MGDKSGIEWTDATWNPVTGCTKVSHGCKNCYAERDWSRLLHLPAYSGRAFTDVAMHPERLCQPLRWGRPRRIFVNSMSDLFHDDVPDMFIDQVFAVMAMAKKHQFQVLTKRPKRMRHYLLAADREESIGWAEHSIYEGFTRIPIGAYRGPTHRRLPLPNVWLGVSVEDQVTADERIPLLLQTPAEVRWISAEPLLGPIDLMNCEHPNYSIRADYLSGQDSRSGDDQGTIDWVVVGGESGPKARPMSPKWARDLRDQCAAAGVPFLFKQWGEWRPSGGFIDGEFEPATHGINLSGDTARTSDLMSGKVNGAEWNGYQMIRRVGKKSAGRLLDGVKHDGDPVAATLSVENDRADHL